MRADEAVARLGGVTTRKALTRLIPERALARAVADRLIVRDGHGRYSLPSTGDAVHAAHALTGTVSNLSAAQYWGWEVKNPPVHPHVTVPRKRQVAPERRLAVQVHWADLAPTDIRPPCVTSPNRTLLDCLTTLPFDAGLALADSALRHGAVTRDDLLAITASAGGRGSATARKVAAHADGRAANPFESVLRAIAIEVPRLQVVPQVQIGEFRPDLVDARRRLVLEADSHTWHSSRAALRRDCRRYNSLVLDGWTVLRFTWEDVMLAPDRVRRDLERCVEQAQPRHSRSKRSN